MPFHILEIRVFFFLEISLTNNKKCTKLGSVQIENKGVCKKNTQKTKKQGKTKHKKYELLNSHMGNGRVL